jgi:hypothetical protein
MADHSGTSDPLGVYGDPTSDSAEISEGKNLDLSHLSEVQRRILSRPSSSANMNHQFDVDITAALISMNANNLSLLTAGANMSSAGGLQLPDDDDGSQPFIFHEGPDADPANMSPEGLANTLVSILGVFPVSFYPLLLPFKQ